MRSAAWGRSPANRRHRLACLALATSLLLVGATHAAAKGPLVQKRDLRITSGTSVGLTFRRPNVAGNLIIAYVVWDNADAVGLTDSAGNDYVSAAGPTLSGDGRMSTQILFAKSIAGGPNSVTANFATAISARAALYIYEYSGLDRTSPLDLAVVASGASPAMASGPLATSVAGELLFLGAESNGRAIRRLARGYRARARGNGILVADRVATSIGSYEATALQLGDAWIMQLVAFKPAGSTPPSTRYPLKVSVSGRYLVDQDDAPFLITGDSPQAAMVNLSEAEADAFFANRQAAGFNLVWINLLCATYTGGRPDGSTYDGIVPFTTPGDLSTPNESYFARVDHILALAAQHGLVVLLDPAETGSFLSVLLDNGSTRSRNYGRYLGTRYRSFDNIVWMSGNDFQSWMNSADDVVVRAVALGIQETDDRHLHTVELDYSVSGSLDDPSWAPIIELNASYTYFPTYAQVLADYNRPNAVPTFLVEANYEFEHNAADEGTPQILRRQEYWSLLSGATGQLYGNRYTWPFIGGWQSHLDTPGSQQVSHVKFLFESRRWYDLIPDQSHMVVTAGYGTFSDGGALGDSDYVTAGRTADGALVMAYMPTARTITVDMSRLAAPAYASWYDPSNGTFTAIPGSPLTNSGARGFAPPGQNGDGDGDWVLLLEASSVPPDDEPPSIPAGLSASTVSSSEILLSWTASSDNNAVAGYRIYRGGTLIRTTPSTSYTDSGLAPLTSYAYSVAAYDYANNISAPSDPVDGETAGQGPTFVQETYAAPQSPQSLVAVTYAEAQADGDTNIVAIGWNDVSSSIVSVHDSAGNVYQPAIATQRGNGLSQAIYYAWNIAAAPAGVNQVTVTFDASAAYVDLRITEYAGLSQTDPLDAGVSATGNGALASTGMLSAPAPSELLFAAGMTGAVFTGPGSGFTSRVITSPDGDLVEDAVALNSGSYAATAPLNGGTWLLQLAAFRAAGAP